MKKILAFLLVLVLIISLFGCNNTPDPTTQTTVPAFVSAYIQASNSLQNAQNLKVELTTKKDITALGGTFSSVSEQELTLTGIGTNAFAATMHEDLDVGGYEDEFTEYFADGLLYVNVYDNGYFYGEMTTERFLERFAPAVLLDETLYADVSSQESETSTTVTFSNPGAAESWALPQGAEFISASGTAKIDSNGALSRTVYTIEYAHGSAVVSMEVTAEAEVYDDAVPEAPKDLSSYIRIDSIEVPRLYDTAILYIYGSETASSTVSDVVTCQAAGYVQATQAELHYIGTDKDHFSKVQQSISVFSSNGSSDSYTMTEKFEDGKYTYSQNGGKFSKDSSITAEKMVAYVQGFYDNNVPALEYIAAAKLENVNGLLYLEMELTSEWGEETAKDLSYQLFKDADFLDDLASGYKTTAKSYYMSLDPATGFPIAACTTFSGEHTIEKQKYVLSREFSQAYRLADSSTYTSLTDKIATETAPAEKATPLLYRVTGTDGQEMYLMGTIHIGDEKTGFLPDEVYAAFDASDALAVEADIIAFEKKLESDDKYASKFAELFTNADNKALKDILDAELYSKAVKSMKATGNYNANAEYMTPYIWSSSIENTYTTLGRLRTEKGMDMRLLMRAMEQNKKILEVESALSQYKMFANFSHDLQLTLLKEAYDTTVAEYCAQTQSLYDLWCAGDETALRESLNEDPSGLTEDELPLYQEYLNAMIIQRNEDMLDVAISYLESDDTVFYAVGLAHLLQENGLVDTLRTAGYTVEQVIYN